MQDIEKYAAGDSADHDPEKTAEESAASAVTGQPDPPDIEGENQTKEINISAGGHAKAKENLSVLGAFVSTFLVACIVIAALALVAVRVTGCCLFNIETGSMTPAYPAGTLVVVRPYSSFDEIQVGDVVTYVMNEEGSTVTHRVVSIDTAGETITTQGDANNTADASPVLYANVVGEVVIGIPKIGGIVMTIKNGKYRIAVIVIIIIVLVWAFLWDWIRNGIQKHMAEKKRE